MTVWGIATVKDEADVIAGTVLHMADELDHLLILDNGSTDGTREILAELADTVPMTVVDDPELAYYQSERMTGLANVAAGEGAQWIVPFDADELWYWRGRRIREELRDVQANVVTADLYNHFPSAVDPEGDDPFRTIVNRQPDPAPLPKVAFRWERGVTIHQGNHGVDVLQPQIARGLEIRHFPYRSAEQFVRKARNGAAAYAATSLPQHVGQHWREYGALLDRHGEQALEDVFREHFWFLAPSLSGLTCDPAPYLRWKSPS